MDLFESLDGKIVECMWDMNEKMWVFLCMRLDKDMLNFIIIYEKTWKLI